MLKTSNRDREEHFRAIIKEHGEKIYNLALLKTNDAQLSEDICQETFIRVFKGLAQFREDASLGTWIYRIALNVCNTQLSKYMAQREKMVPLDMDELENIRDEEQSVEDMVFYASDVQSIRQAILALPKHQSDAVTLYFLQDYRYREVAEIMNIPINTVKSHLRRAKQALSHRLSQEASQ